MKASEIARQAVKHYDAKGAPWNLELAEHAVNLALEAAAQICEDDDNPHRSPRCAAAIRAMMEPQ